MIDLAKQLKPCACGARPKIRAWGGWFHVYCPKCGFRIDQERPSPFDATHDWNFFRDAQDAARKREEARNDRVEESRPR